MTPDASQLSTRKVRDICILEMPARVTAGIKESVDEKVYWVLADTPGAVLVDFAGVREADTQGIGTLEFLFSRTDEVDIPVVLASVGEPSRSLLDKAGFLGMAAEVAESVQAWLDRDQAGG